MTDEAPPTAALALPTGGAAPEAPAPALPTAPPELATGALPASAGARLARGAARALRDLGFLALEEFVLASGLRVDLMALGPKGEIWVVECKSSRADFRADGKWQGYLAFCDRFFWAVGADFPIEILPGETGLILADAWGGELVRMGPETPLAAARRKAVTLKFARSASERLLALRDPAGAGLSPIG